MPLRVVLTSTYSWPEVVRGGERYLHELAAALRRAGHEVRVVSTSPTGGQDRVLGVDVTRYHRRSVWTSRFGELSGEVAFGAQTLLHDVGRGADVWHAMTTADAAAAAATGRIRRRLRSVFTAHGYPAAASRERRPDARLHRFVVRRVDAYVCVSHAAGEYLSRDYGRVATIVPPGVRLDDFRPGRRHATPVLLYAGSLSETRKNIPLLLQAAWLLRAAHPGLQVWLLGPGDASRALAAAGDAASLVTRCGVVPAHELARAYAAAWVTVLPSVAESFGMVVVESLASGTPVVVRSDSGGPAEIVDDERIGRLAGATAASLAAACEQALDLARDSATAPACRTHAAAYDWDTRVLPALLDAYAG